MIAASLLPSSPAFNRSSVPKHLDLQMGVRIIRLTIVRSPYAKSAAPVRKRVHSFLSGSRRVWTVDIFNHKKIKPETFDFTHEVIIAVVNTSAVQIRLTNDHTRVS